MPALLATFHDLIVGLGYGVVFAIVITALGALTGKSMAKEPPRFHLEREPHVDLEQAIRQHESLRRGRGRGAR